MTKKNTNKQSIRQINDDTLAQVSAGGPGRDDFGDWVGRRLGIVRQIKQWKTLK